jgi:F420-non-reducing hydrogenase small subunit
MYIATVALSSCGGCENSLLSAGEPLVALLSEHTMAFSSLLVDRRNISPSDVVLACGCLRTPEEIELATDIARTSRKIIAVGTCAVYGGVAGLGRGKAAEADEKAEVPAADESSSPLDSSVPVELYVPGCPPPPLLILDALKSVVEGYTPLHFETTVCSDCARGIARKSSRTLTMHPGPGVPDGTCLLNSGVLCMGPVTRGGCRAACPSAGAACAGCRGPSDMVLSSALHSVRSDMASYISKTSGAREDKVLARLSEMMELLYMFTGRDPETRMRAKERVPGA